MMMKRVLRTVLSGLTLAASLVLPCVLDASGEEVRSSSLAVGETESDSDHWAFQPLRRATSPDPAGAEWPKGAVDAFVLSGLDRVAIRPSPRAAKTRLIRRLSFDLTGFPPTPHEVTEFLSDSRPAAYERLVDRLLASPHFGEKWARYWLDLARYSDSDGYRGDGFRPHAWRYRHWVIGALNRDQRFDRFTTEQIAGDLLPAATVEQKVATGFHRNTSSNREGGTNLQQFRFEQVVNRINTVGTTWLGLTVGCAQCHDHKYDPLTQEEYYRLFAFFNDAEEVNIDAPLPGEMEPYLQAVDAYRQARQQLLTQYRVGELQPPWEQRLLEARAHPGRWPSWDKALGTVRVGAGHPVWGMGEKILLTPADQRNEKETKLLTDHFIQFSTQVVPPEVYEKELKFAELRQKLQQLEADFPGLSQAQTITAEKKLRESHVHVRGDYRRPSETVQPGVPAVLHDSATDSRPPRVRLAEWLVAADNPLTARVMVNRLWQELFGRGIVASSDDFGAQGDLPTHPELLDWLAYQFRGEGWSIKRTIRTIVLSATYRQDSALREDLTDSDPDNRWLARQARLRLPAELIRDAALHASGLLAAEIGGKSVRPPLPDGAKVDQSKWVESQGRQRHRRGLYIQFQRMSPYPFMTNFDVSTSYTAVCRRDRSNTPLQALNLLNDPVFFEATQALAVRVLKTAPNDEHDRLALAFRLCLARTPSSSERAMMAAAIARQREVFFRDTDLARAAFPFDLAGVSQVEGATWVGVARILLNLDEFVTRE